MNGKFNKNPFHENTLDNKFYNQNHLYFQGALHTIDNSSNKLYENYQKPNKIKTIRLFSANNSLPRNKKYESQDKLKIYKNSAMNNNDLHSSNFNTLQSRPTSVKQNHINFIYQTKRKGTGFGYSTDLNYPQININSTISQVNNVPFQRRRKIVYEEDNELADEYDKLRKIWKEAGVTDLYMDNFETITNNQNNSKEEILQSLKNEEEQMIKFKEEMLKVVSEIIKRENDIKNIKELNKSYLNIKTRLNINPKRNIKNNNYIKEEKEDLNSENKENEIEKRKNLEKEKQKIEEEIERCLNYIRLHGINVVGSIKKFNMRYEHLLNAGKVDLDYLKQKYGYDKDYLMKLKTDLDFLKDTDIGDLYHFNPKGKDPFLVSLSINEHENNKEEKYKYKILPI